MSEHSNTLANMYDEDDVLRAPDIIVHSNPSPTNMGVRPYGYVRLRLSLSHQHANEVH
jgi:hypothetical protein